MMFWTRISIRVFLAIVLLALPCSVASQAASSGLTSQLLDGLHARSIGPAVAGGRIHDIEVQQDDASTLFVASASGGLWKSTNRGTMWRNVFADQPVSTFGDVAIAPSNPQIVWAGTGEQNNRQSSSWGNGVYRSTDGGNTWTHLGLENTRHIGKIQVHPTNPDLAYVAGIGNLWAASADRGVFRTTDGGSTWQKVLYVDTLTGATDLVMDPSNPNTLYAATYQRQRRAFGFNGAGPGSGIFKTTDGGSTWRRVTSGLPAGDKGRIGLAIARSNPRVLNAIVQADAADQGVYRSEDGGDTWTKMSSQNPRPMYYSHIFIDPRNDRRVYILGTTSYTSEDGGRTWVPFAGAPTYDVGVHADHHALWIDPADSRHILLGGDGGLYETWDQGRAFRKIDNIPIAQYYAIGVDMRDPYYVYGGLQDNHSWMVPSATRSWAGILRDDFTQIQFGDGMYHQPDPTSHRYVYSNANGGSLTRVDAETGDILAIRPRPAPGEEAYRFDWVTPS
ncbi:MAG: WD40/YVTN/BNR-like repeat-containing protein, partial [Longimicrobiales bacterium]